MRLRVEPSTIGKMKSTKSNDVVNRCAPETPLFGASQPLDEKRGGQRFLKQPQLIEDWSPNEHTKLQFAVQDLDGWAKPFLLLCGNVGADELAHPANTA